MRATHTSMLAQRHPPTIRFVSASRQAGYPHGPSTVLVRQPGARLLQGPSTTTRSRKYPSMYDETGDSVALADFSVFDILSTPTAFCTTTWPTRVQSPSQKHSSLSAGRQTLPLHGTLLPHRTLSGPQSPSSEQGGCLPNKRAATGRYPTLTLTPTQAWHPKPKLPANTQSRAGPILSTSPRTSATRPEHHDTNIWSARRAPANKLARAGRGALAQGSAAAAELHVRGARPPQRVCVCPGHLEKCGRSPGCARGACCLAKAV